MAHLFNRVCSSSASMVGTACVPLRPLMSTSSFSPLLSLSPPGAGRTTTVSFQAPAALLQQQRGFGAGDLKIVAARMKSVKSIQKITKAMKMVAASKLRMDQRRLENGLPFATPIQTPAHVLLKKEAHAVFPGSCKYSALSVDGEPKKKKQEKKDENVTQTPATLEEEQQITGRIGVNVFEDPHRLFQRIPIDAEKKAPLTILALSSDKGLCGGVNSFVAKQTRLLIKENEQAGHQVRVYGVGDKIRSALQRNFGNRFERVFAEITRYPWNFVTACIVAERLMQDAPMRLAIVYNHFKSAVSYDTLTLNVLTAQQAAASPKKELNNYEFEPERTDVWKDLQEFYYACTVYGCMLDNIASEQSARMSAMDNASSNAGEMISSLTLKYNRARQAKITTELVEIISGANALA